LQPNGKVSRAEIGRAFWPGAERHLVAQSLRTACSNIRKAIAQIVGVKQVDAYFRAGDELAINLENVIVDVNRFILHANDADEEYMRGELRPAYAHYRSAARLYRDDLLPGDAPEPWVGSLGAELKRRHVKVLARVAEVGAALGYEGAEKRKLRRVSGS
jgi:DNA-binding SARP family transcriptional activator